MKSNLIIFKHFLPQENTLHFRELMLFIAIIALYSKNHVKLKNKICGKNSAFFNVKGADICTYHWDSGR
jgi:hypothetical protein